MVIVGAGPAGAAAALAARSARPGASVLLVDRETFPRDKACGDAIGPHAVALLSELGAADAVAGYRRIARFELTAGCHARVRAPLPGATYTVPRRVFDDRLLSVAVAAGATLRRHRVRRLVQYADRVVLDGTIAGRVVIAADGANSRVRHALGHPRNPAHALAVAMRGYAATGDRVSQRIMLDEARWPAYGWSFAIGDGTANVGWGAVRATFEGTAEDLRRRVREIAGGPVADLSAHHLPLSTWRPPPADGRVLLAGDAASLINPLSGEGIFYALLSGMIAGRAAVAPGDVGRRYASALQRRLGRHLRHTRTVARLSDHRRLRAAAVRAAGSSPRAFRCATDLVLGDGLLTVGLAGATVRQTLRPVRVVPWDEADA